MNFLDPFNNKQQVGTPPPAARSSQGMNYGGAQQRNQQPQQGYIPSPQQQQQQQQQQKSNTLGMSSLSMLDPLAKNHSPVVRGRKEVVRERVFGKNTFTKSH